MQMQFITKPTQSKVFNISSSFVGNWPAVWAEYVSSTPDWSIIDEALKKVSINVIGHFWPKLPDTVSTTNDQVELVDVVFEVLRNIKPSLISSKWPTVPTPSQINSYFFTSGIHCMFEYFDTNQKMLDKFVRLVEKMIEDHDIDPDEGFYSPTPSFEKELDIDNKIDDAIEKLKGTKKLADAIRYKKKTGSSKLIDDIEEVLRRRAYRKNGTIHIRMKDNIPEVLLFKGSVADAFDKWIYHIEDFIVLVDADVCEGKLALLSNPNRLAQMIQIVNEVSEKSD